LETGCQGSLDFGIAGVFSDIQFGKRHIETLAIEPNVNLRGAGESSGHGASSCRMGN
jgi:hypothetical protein